MIAPTFQTFNFQIDSIDWNRFYDTACVAVIYQHFGSFYVAEKNIPTTLTLIKKFPYYLKAFYFLKQEQDMGNLAVVKTSNLLRYCAMYFTTKVEIKETKEVDIYLINNYELIEDLSFFDGLTIYVKNPRRTIKVIYNNQEVNFIRNGLDMRQKYSITIDSKRSYYGMG